MQFSEEKPPRRRHDLDALRAFAMLLGIALHGALSFLPIPWPVRDSQQHELFGWFVSAVHGFRMPVFFLMSGFFTALLWRRRGLRSLVIHRIQRIFLPLLLGIVTVVPAVEWISHRALEQGASQASSAPATESAEGARDLDQATGLAALSQAVIEDDAAAVQRLLESGVSADVPNKDGSTPLIVAALYGRSEAAGLLIEAGANLDVRSADGSTPLHTATFFGRFDVARRLLEAGADSSLKNSYGQTPAEVLAADWQTTTFIAKLVGVELEKEQVEAEREKIAKLLGMSREELTAIQKSGPTAGLGRLLHEPFFHHLWFLWFLCWLVAAFVAYAVLAERRGWQGLPRGLVVSPLRLLWLVPMTCIPQFFMGRLFPVFGADTSAGLLPMPHVLAFYAIFFFFGALYYDVKDEDGRVGKWWPFSLALGLIVLFPIGAGLAFTTGHNAEPGVRMLSTLVQSIYPWVMAFGLMGLFRRLLARELPGLRYLSDASYWLYLTHLPLIMWAQLVVRDWQFPPLVKFIMVCLPVTALLLLIYQLGVRYTWIGRLLNGPRERPSKAMD